LTIRKLAVKILTEICSGSSENTQLFVACNGLSALVGILSYDFETEADLICTSIKNIVEIVSSRGGSSQGKTVRREAFCRMFVQAGLLPPMAAILLHFSHHSPFGERDREDQALIDNICSLSTTLSQSESEIRLEMSDPLVLSKLTKTLYAPGEGAKALLNAQNTLQLCKTIKNIALDSEARDNITRAGTLTAACELLKVDLFQGTQESLQIRFYLLDFVAEMCNLSKSRTEIVARTRVFPTLRSFLATNLQSTALSIIMGLWGVSDVNKGAMHELIDDGLAEVYVFYLDQPFWGTKAITVIASLVIDPSFGVEPLLLRNESIQKFRQGVKAVNAVDTPSFVRPLTSICTRSPALVERLVDESFAQIIVEKFALQQGPSQLPAAMLELISALLKSRQQNATDALVSRGSLHGIIRKFTLSRNIREKTFAREILKYFPS
jgi:hypothetical protein